MCVAKPPSFGLRENQVVTKHYGKNANSLVLISVRQTSDKLVSFANSKQASSSSGSGWRDNKSSKHRLIAGFVSPPDSNLALSAISFDCAITKSLFIRFNA